MALLIGGGLSVSGVLFQGTLRNPLADPYIIGVSAGASLGATLGLLYFIPPRGLAGFGALPVFAFLGALAATAAVARLGSRRGGRLEPTGLILAGGVAIGGAFFDRNCLLADGFADSKFARRLSMADGQPFGGAGGWRHFFCGAALCCFGTAAAVWLARDLNVYLLGEEVAHSLGLDVQRLQRRVLITGALVAAACVAVSGVIGFVGLMVPHALRLVIGGEHKRLIGHSFWVGALFLLLADTLARTAFAPRWNYR